jgi:hypothetical protein
MGEPVGNIRLLWIAPIHIVRLSADEEICIESDLLPVSSIIINQPSLLFSK